jgi:hypothetical protein
LEHILHHLNAIGHEAPIVKELMDLPKSIDALYEQMIYECQEHRGQGELLVLKLLFAWLSHARLPARLATTNAMLGLIDPESTINLDSELTWRLRRYESSLNCTVLLINVDALRHLCLEYFGLLSPIPTQRKTLLAVMRMKILTPS